MIYLVNATIQPVFDFQISSNYMFILWNNVLNFSVSNYVWVNILAIGVLSSRKESAQENL